ncbi:MAG TPA: alanine racemase [Candidatus Kapabacteria bacterium]|nr:alanine racemase [Candidatus Kapabacteria bacterium]
MVTERLTTIPRRAAWAEIRLQTLAQNLKNIRKTLQKNVNVMAVVKANAYGHGAIECSRVLLESGASMLGVALLQEAIELRTAGISAPILVMTPPLPEEADTYISNEIDFTLCKQETAELFSARAEALGKTVAAHVKIDTGMGRVGILPVDALEFVRFVDTLPNIRMQGIATHYASSDEDLPYTATQLHSFTSIVKELEQNGFSFPIRHSANSGAILNLAESHLNCVRPGVILYGYMPSQNMRSNVTLEPVLSLKAKVDFVKRVPVGTSISYGRTFFTDMETTIATVPLGYADGYSRLLSGKAHAIVNGKKFPVVGRVCMDQIMVDVGNEPVEEGDVLTLIGRDGTETITAWDIANAMGTIPYEVLTMISSRIPRIFI